jgi:hypothetical protein
MKLFWGMTDILRWLSSWLLRTDDGGSKHLCNVGKLVPLHDDTTEKTAIFTLAAVKYHWLALI